MIKNILQNRIGQLALLQSLLFAFSEFFMWSNNSHMFSVEQIVYSSITVIGISIILFFITYYLGKIFLHFFKFKYAEPIYAVTIITLTNIIINKFLFINLLYPNHHLAYGLILIILGIYYLNKINFLVIFSSCLLAIVSINLIVNMSSNSLEAQKIVEKLDNGQLNFDITKLKLEKKPNIYLFWLESYHDFETLNKIYKINTSSMEKYLSDNNFMIYPDTYSNSPFTLLSFVDVFSLGKISGYEVGKADHDSLYLVREIIGGNKYNLLYSILKNNDYATWLLLFNDVSYYFSKQNLLLDHMNVQSNPNSLVEKLMPVFRFSRYFTWYTYVLFDNQVYTLLPEFSGDIVNQVKTAINIAKKEKKSYFMSFKGGAKHVELGNYNYNKNFEEWRSSYQDAVLNSNKELYEITQYIIENDPSSIIILLGDHGSHAYWGLGDSSDNDYKLNQEKYQITPEMIAKDNFGVIMGIRLPYGEKVDLEKGYYLNHKNLFLHLFSYLTNDWDLLKYRRPSNSVTFSKYVLVEDGKVKNIK